MGPFKTKKQAQISGILVVLLVLAVIFLISRPPEQNIGLTGEPTQIKYGVTLKNKTNSLITDGQLYLFSPVPETAFQSSKAIKANYPFQTKKDDLGNQVLVFAVEDLPPFATRLVQISAEISHYAVPQKTGIKDFSPYLQPEPFIESAHPDLVRRARKLAHPKSAQTAKNIYEWVSSHIKATGYTKEKLGALHALKTAQGDCTEFMYLFVALCRTNNIPARGMGGYVCAGNCILKSSDYHNWAEVYLDGKWVLADCQKKVFGKESQGYIAMNIISDRAAPVMKGYQRFRYQGTGVSVRMNR